MNYYLPRDIAVEALGQARFDELRTNARTGQRVEVTHVLTHTPQDRSAVLGWLDANHHALHVPATGARIAHVDRRTPADGMNLLPLDLARRIFGDDRANDLPRAICRPAAGLCLQLVLVAPDSDADGALMRWIDGNEHVTAPADGLGFEPDSLLIQDPHAPAVPPHLLPSPDAPRTTAPHRARQDTPRTPTGTAMSYLLPDDLATAALGAARASALSPYAYFDADGNTVQDLLVQRPADREVVETWMAANPHRQEALPGLPDGMFRITAGRAADTAPAPAEAPVTHLVEPDLARTIFGEATANSLPAIYLADLQGRVVGYRAVTPRDQGPLHLLNVFCDRQRAVVGRPRDFELEPGRLLVQAMADHPIRITPEPAATPAQPEAETSPRTLTAGRTGWTYLLPRPLAQQILGNDRMRALPGFTLRDARGRPHDLVVCARHSRPAYEVEQWMDGRDAYTDAHNSYICARPAGMGIDPSYCIVQETLDVPLDLGDTPGVIRGRMPDNPPQATAPEETCTCVLPGPLAQRIFGPAGARQLPSREIRFGGETITLRIVRPDSSLAGHLAIWRERNRHEISQPAALDLDADTWLIQSDDVRPFGGSDDPLHGVSVVLMPHALAERVLGHRRARELRLFSYRDTDGADRDLPSIRRGTRDFTTLRTFMQHDTLHLRAVPGLSANVRLLDDTDGPTANAAPAEPGTLDQGLEAIDQAFEAVIGSALGNLRQERGRVAGRLRQAREQVVRDTRQMDALDRQIAALSEGSPQQAFRDGIDRMLDDGTITHVRSERVPQGSRNSVIVLTTPPLTCTRSSDGAKFDVGRFELLIDFVDASVRFRNLDLKHPHYVHPHVSREGRACLGNAAEAIQQMVSRLEVVALTGLLIDFLSNANADDSWGETVAEWPMVQDGDGDPVDPPMPEVDPDEGEADDD